MPSSFASQNVDSQAPHEDSSLRLYSSLRYFTFQSGKSARTGRAWPFVTAIKP